MDITYFRRLDQQSRMLQFTVTIRKQSYIYIIFGVLDFRSEEEFYGLMPRRQDNAEPHLPGRPGISKLNIMRSGLRRLRLSLVFIVIYISEPGNLKGFFQSNIL